MVARIVLPISTDARVHSILDERPPADGDEFMHVSTTLVLSHPVEFTGTIEECAPSLPYRYELVVYGPKAAWDHRCVVAQFRILEAAWFSVSELAFRWLRGYGEEEQEDLTWRD